MSYKLSCEVHVHPELCEFGQLLHSVSVLHRWTHEKMQQRRGFTRALGFDALVRIAFGRDASNFSFSPNCSPPLKISNHSE